MSLRFKLPGKYKKYTGNRTARDFLLVLFFFYLAMKEAGATFIVAREMGCRLYLKGQEQEKRFQISY